VIPAARRIKDQQMDILKLLFSGRLKNWPGTNSVPEGEKIFSSSPLIFFSSIFYRLPATGNPPPYR
jgi:hypothetical protein